MNDSGCISISTPTHPVVTVVVLLLIDSDCIKPDGEDVVILVLYITECEGAAVGI